MKKAASLEAAFFRFSCLFREKHYKRGRDNTTEHKHCKSTGHNLYE
jgi:hypothetical protein